MRRRPCGKARQQARWSAACGFRRSQSRAISSRQPRCGHALVPFWHGARACNASCECARSYPFLMMKYRQIASPNSKNLKQGHFLKPPASSSSLSSERPPGRPGAKPRRVSLPGSGPISSGREVSVPRGAPGCSWLVFEGKNACIFPGLGAQDAVSSRVPPACSTACAAPITIGSRLDGTGSNGITSVELGACAGGRCVPTQCGI